MPNGRSGGFLIETADLTQLAQAVSGDTVVGKLLPGRTRDESLPCLTDPEGRSVRMAAGESRDQ
jgi:hypothetical protein